MNNTLPEDLEIDVHESRNNLINMVVHDLKNPLTSILLGVAFLQQRWQILTLEELSRGLKRIEDSAMYMQDIIHRLLTASSIDTGHFYFTLEQVELIGLYNSVIQEYTNRAVAKNITIHFKHFIPSFYIRSNRHVIREIAENLLSNAIKYSPRGKQVWINIISGVVSAFSEHHYDHPATLRELPYSGDFGNFIRIEISDEGPGISENDKKHLFTKFSRLSAKPTAGEDSTGLGLFIVKKLTEALNGHVWCVSEFGKGATFIVELPIVTTE